MNISLHIPPQVVDFPRISVIIPCFNQGAFLEESVNSILNQTYQNFEVIIVDDGSTQPRTKTILQHFKKPRTRVIRTPNFGLAAARNTGIESALGEYILPLDADDRVGPEYLKESISLLDQNPGLGIVYCEAEFFGSKSGKWTLPAYSLHEMLLNNIIFCSAVFRKDDWRKVGGYDPKMRFGWEDYDFWLSLIESGCDVYQIPKTLFYYRVTPISMIRSATEIQKREMILRIYRKHHKLYKRAAFLDIRVVTSTLFSRKTALKSEWDIFNNIRRIAGRTWRSRLREQGIGNAFLYYREFLRKSESKLILHFLYYMTLSAKKWVYYLNWLVRK
jgi:glycosyltransferase involved in cell wall biosynthesis